MFLLLFTFLIGVNTNGQTTFDFDNGLPAGWSNVDESSAGFNWEFTDGGTDFNPQALFSGQFAIIDSDDAGSGAGNVKASLISGPINVSSLNGGIFLSFDHLFRESSATSGKVLVSNDGGANYSLVNEYTTNQGTTSGIGTVDITPVATEFDITSYVGGANDIQIKFEYDDLSNWEWYWMVDNVSVFEVPCVSPTNPVVDYVTNSEVGFSWTASPTETGGYEWVIMDDGVAVDVNNAVDNGSVGSSMTNANATLPDTNTAYDLFLRTDCGSDGFSDYEGPVNFTTSCDAETAPYDENFDAGDFDDVNDTIDDCWGRSNDGSGFSWEVNSGPTTSGPSTGPDNDVTGGGNYLFTEASFPFQSGDETFLNLPPVDLSNLTVPTITFFYHMFDDGQDEMGTLSVEVKDESDSNYTEVFSKTGQQQSNTDDAFIEGFIDLTEYGFDNQTVDIRFKGVRGDGFRSDIAIDEVSVEEAPPCPQPDIDDVTLVNEFGQSAEFSWVDVPDALNGYIWEVYEDGEDPNATAPFSFGTVPAGTTEVLADELLPETDYEFYVASDCGQPGISSLTGPVDFTTKVICPVPEDFAITNLQSTSVDLNWSPIQNDANGYNWSVFNDGDDPATDDPVASGNVDPGDSSVNVTGLTEQTMYEAYISVDCDSDGTSELSDALAFKTLCSTFVAPYAENFDGGDFVEGSGFDNDGDAIDFCWNRDPLPSDASDPYSWGTGAGETSSDDTGPSDVSATGNYLFTEGSDGTTGDLAFINLPAVDLSNLVNPSISFDYHMFGNDIGSLSVEVKEITSNTYTEVTNISGQQQSGKDDPFINEIVDLDAFSGEVVDIRFVAEKGGANNEADIAIDEVSVEELPTAQVQIIHNSADPSAQFVDIYLDGTLILNDFEFRNATSFLEVKAEQEINIDIAPDDSDGLFGNGVGDSFFNLNTTLTEDESYIAVANGVRNPSQFDESFNTIDFGIDVFQGAQQSSNNVGETSVLVHHGSTDTPPVDLINDDNGNVLVNSILYKEFDGYLDLPTQDYSINVDVNSNVIGNFAANLQSLNLADDAITVVASGFRNPSDNQFGEDFGLFAALPGGGPLVEFPEATAEVQLIHNSADPAAEFVDVYLDGVLIADDFEFRNATSFLQFPAGAPIDIDVAPQNSTDVGDSVFNLNTTLTADEKYIAVANGVLDASNFDGAAGTIGFGINVTAGAQQTSTNAGETSVLVHHGSTDAPMVDVRETSVPAGIIVDDISYTEFQGYLELATQDYTLDVELGDNSAVVESYEAPLQSLGLTDSAITIVASGFLDPSNNQNGEDFGLWVASPMGGPLTKLPVNDQTDYCGGDNFYDNGGSSNNYANNSDEVTTISPDNAGDLVTVEFLSFAVENGFDGLLIYDGPDTSAPLIDSGGTGFPTAPDGAWTGSGTTDPFSAEGETFVSTHPSGALTFRFLSDGATTAAGWEANVTCTPQPKADLQIIHNSADPNAEFVDVYLDGVLIANDFEFRNATSFLEVPAEQEINIDIAPQNSIDTSDSFFNLSTTLTEDETYIAVANGVRDPSQFDDSVNTIDFNIDVFEGAQQSSTNPGETSVLVHHGSTDAPTVDVRETSVPAGIIVDDISYPEFQGYLDLATQDYTLNVELGDNSLVVESYEAPLQTLGLTNDAITVVASGFLDPALNQDGEAFGLWVALPGGGQLLELPIFIPTPANDDVCDAINLTVGATSAGDAFTNVGATEEPNEPVAECFNNGIDGSVWFTFDAPASGNVSVSTDIAGGTLTDTEVAVYGAPTDCTDLTTLGAELGCNQDGGEDVIFNSVVDLTGLTPGTTYYVQVDQWGAATEGTFGIEVQETLSSESFSDDNFSFYPNPTENRLNLQTTGQVETVKVYNMLGQEVMKETPNTVSPSLNVQALQAGNYIMNVTIDGTTSNFRFIKK